MQLKRFLKQNHFSIRRPSGRFEVLMLRKTMDKMLEYVGSTATEQDLSVEGPSQVWNVWFLNRYLENCRKKVELRLNDSVCGVGAGKFNREGETWSMSKNISSDGACSPLPLWPLFGPFAPNQPLTSINLFSEISKCHILHSIFKDHRLINN